MSLAEWMPLLGWNKLPHFGDIHQLEPSDFLGYYFANDPQIARMTSNLLIGLRGEQPSNINTRLIGGPGVGKTTYIYYLRAIAKAENQNDFSNYYYWIFQSERSISHDSIKQEVIESNIEKCFLRWFVNSDVEHTLLKKVYDENLTSKEKITFLTELYINNKEVRKKMKNLIYVIDGVDTIDEELVIPLVKEIMTHLVPLPIRVILTIREVEYKLLSEPTTRYIDTFFPAQKTFPPIDLHNIVEKRISSTAGTINPFSSALCSYTMDVFNNDHRQGLARLIHILEETSPGKIDATNEGFVQKFIQRQALGIFFKAKDIPNIYERSFLSNKTYCLEKEVLLLLVYNTQIDEDFASIINDGLNATFQNLFKSDLKNKISLLEIKSSIDYLENMDLLRIHKEKRVITPKGWQIVDAIQFEYYQKICKEQLEEKWQKNQRGILESFFCVLGLQGNYF